MIELTEQQQRELGQSGWPPRIVNPKTRQTFVLLPQEMFERVRARLEAEDEIPSVEEMYPLVTEAVAGVRDITAPAAPGGNCLSSVHSAEFDAAALEAIRKDLSREQYEALRAIASGGGPDVDAIRRMRAASMT